MSKIPSGFNQSESLQRLPNIEVWEGPQGIGRASVPSASAIRNLLPARTASVPSLHQRNNARGGRKFPSLVAQNQSRTASHVANAQTTAAHAAAQLELLNGSPHKQKAGSSLEGQPQVINKHGRLPGGSVAGFTLSAPNFITDARRNPSLSPLFIPNTPCAAASAPVFVPNTQQAQPAEACAPVVFPGTPNLCSHETAGRSQTRQRPSEISYLGVATNSARSTHSNQRFQRVSNQLAPAQASAASHQSSYASRPGSPLGAPRHTNNPPLSFSLRAMSSPTNSATLRKTQSSPYTPRTQDQDGLGDVSRTGAPGAVHSETNIGQDKSAPPAVVIDEAPRDQEPGPCLKSTNVHDATLLPPTEARSRQELEITLDAYNGTDSEAAPDLLATDQGKVAMQPFGEIPKTVAVAETPKGLNPPSTTTSGDYSLKNQQHAGIRPLARGSTTVLHDAILARHGLALLPSRREDINTEVDSATAIDHPVRVTVDSQKATSTGLEKHEAPSLTTSVTVPLQSPSVGGQQHDNQQQGKGKEPVSAVNPRLICAKCKRIRQGSGDWIVHCSGCKDAWYCSSSCQRAAWKSHFMVCKKTEQPRSTLPDIPTEVPEIGARNDPHDEFNTALMPLSEDLPCMICEGTQEHQPDCMDTGEC